MKTEIKTGLILGIIILIGVTSLYLFYTEIDLKKNTTNQLDTKEKILLKNSPTLRGITGFINTTENELEQLIQGNVVLYDFWTYSCINCIRTLPHITAWSEKYANEGLVIVGIHSPEFQFEKEKENVMSATKQFGIDYPVAVSYTHLTLPTNREV